MDQSLFEIIKKMEAKGFYKYIDSGSAKLAKKNSLDSKLILLEETKRVYFIDPESIVEDGVSSTMEDLSTIFEVFQIPLPSIEEILVQGKSFSINLDGKSHTIWSIEDGLENICYKSTLRFLKAVSIILAEAGADEKIYFDYGTNDTLVCFLTKELFELLANSSHLDKGVNLKDLEEISMNSL